MQSRPIPRGETPASLKYLGPPTYAHTVEPRTNKFDMVIYVERRVFLGGQLRFHSKRLGPQRPHFFCQTCAHTV